MEPTLSSETSAFILRKPGKLPKEYRLRDVKSTFGRTSHSWRDIRTSLVAVGLLFMPVQEFYVIEFRWFCKLQTNKNILIVGRVVFCFTGNLPYTFQRSVSIQNSFATRSRRPLGGERDFRFALPIRSDGLVKRSNSRSVLDDTSIY